MAFRTRCIRVEGLRVRRLERDGVPEGVERDGVPEKKEDSEA